MKLLTHLRDEWESHFLCGKLMELDDRHVVPPPRPLRDFDGWMERAGATCETCLKCARAEQEKGMRRIAKKPVSKRR